MPRLPEHSDCPSHPAHPAQPDKREGGSPTGPADSAVPEPVRLSRYLARAGVASRRAAEELISAGRVTVNGEVVTELGSKVVPGRDAVAFDGTPVTWGDAPVTIMLNKPAGYLTSMSDPFGRPCVAELVPLDAHPALFPVGRLDHDTTGLLLFSTDGDLGNLMLHPRHHVEKSYEALVEGRLREGERRAMEDGLVLDDGPTKPARVRLLHPRPGDPRGTSRIEVVISEGRKRQVKRMCEAVGHPVLELHRHAFGPLRLGTLEEGSWRELTDGELAALRLAAQGKGPAKPKSPTGKPSGQPSGKPSRKPAGKPFGSRSKNSGRGQGRSRS